MITERVGRFTTEHPWTGIAVILMITLGAVLSMVANPMEESFENEDFLPDIDVARANILYSETFTSSYPFLVLVRSDDGDLVEPEDFAMMSTLSALIEENSTYLRWKDESSTGPTSPASAMFEIRKGVSNAEAIISTGNAAASYLRTTTEANGSVSSFIAAIGSGDGEGISENLSGAREALASLVSTLEMPPPGPEVPQDPVGYYTSFETVSGFKEEVAYLLSYDISNSSIQDAIASLNAYAFAGGSTLENLMTAKATAASLLEEENSSGNITGDLEGLIEDIDEAVEELSPMVTLSGARGNPLVFGQVAQSVGAGQFILTNFLTEDFDPVAGELSAKGAMVLVNLDNSLYDMEDEGNLDLLLRIEDDLSAIVNDLDDGTESSYHPLANERINQRITEASNESMQILLPAAMIFVLIILFFIYRSFIDIAINVVALVMAIIWMYGFGSLMGYSSNPMITAVPVLLVGLGIDYGIHLTMRYREEIRKGKKVKEALTVMSASVGMALLLATFTTVFAFLSNVTSPVGLILQFGVMAAVGILASFFIMLIFVPSVKVLIDMWKAKKGWTLFGRAREGECDLCEIEKVKKRPSSRIITGLALRAEKHPIVILISVSLITMVMLGFAVQSEVTFDVNDFLPDDLQESKDINYLFTEFRLGGSGETGVIIVEGDISNPRVLLAMQETMDNAVEIDSEYIATEGSGDSVRPKADFILYSMKDAATSLGAFDYDSTFLTNYTTIFDLDTGLPKDVATEDGINSVMVEFHDLFPSLANRVIHVREGRVTMSAIAFTVYTEDDDEAWELFDQLEEITFPLEELDQEVKEVMITGSTILMAVIIDSINSSQISSLVLTIIVSFVVLTIAFFIEERSLFLGGVATLPVVFCVIWIAGTMYIVGIPLNVMTITIGALTVGLGITYGIHITHRFIEDERNETDLMEASRKTIMNTGSALFGAALTTVGGFVLLTFATMPPLQQFGQVTALAIIYSFIASVLVLPVLLILWAKSRRRWRARKVEKATS